MCRWIELQQCIFPQRFIRENLTLGSFMRSQEPLEITPYLSAKSATAYGLEVDTVRNRPMTWMRKLCSRTRREARSPNTTARETPPSRSGVQRRCGFPGNSRTRRSGLPARSREHQNVE